MSGRLVLVSHALCPYVQRAAIVLAEKGVPFERRDIDLANKPAWFLAVSPLGKTPVLLIDGTPIFESAVICEYLDDTLEPRLHPHDPLVRARHRAWMVFGSTVLDAIGGLYNAPDEPALASRLTELRGRFLQLEAALGDGPWFAGAHFGMVDAAFGPVFRYFEVIDRFVDPGLWRDLPKVQRWRQALRQRASVRDAVSPSYAEALLQFLQRRDTELGRRVRAAA